MAVIELHVGYLISTDYLAPTKQAFIVMIPTNYIYLPTSVVPFRLETFIRKGKFRQRKLAENNRVVELSTT